MPILSKKDVTLYDFCTHEGLFGDFSPKSDTWFGWNVLFKAFSGLPMDKAEQRFYGEASGGLVYNPKKKPSNGLFLIGRKGGKTFNISRIASYRTLTFDIPLAPGEFARNLVISPSYRTSDLAINFCFGLLEGSPALSQYITRRKMTEQVALIQLSNKCGIQSLPVNRVSGRGPSIYTLILEEAAFLKKEGLFSDQAIWEACRPGMIRFGEESSYFIITSPGTKDGIVYQNFRDYFGVDNDELLVINGPSKMFNPSLSDKFLEKERRKDEQYYEREYLAKFVDALSAAFSGESVERAIVRGTSERPYEEDQDYYGFVDPSGLSDQSQFNDAFVSGVGHLHNYERRTIDVIKAWTANKGAVRKSTPDEAIAESIELFKKYHVQEVMADKYAGGWIKPRFEEAGFVFHNSPVPKWDLYLELIPSFNNNSIDLVDNETMEMQLKAMERKVGAYHGKDKIDHIKGRKDDFANVVAGLNYMLNQHVGTGVSFSWV